METATKRPPPEHESQSPTPALPLGEARTRAKSHLSQSPHHHPENPQPCSHSLPAGRRPLCARGPRARGRGRNYRRVSPVPSSFARPGAAAEARPPSCPGVSALKAPLGSNYPVPVNDSSAELLYPGSTTSLHLFLLFGR